MDQEYFTAQAEAITGLLYRVAYTILRNDADCQDAVQEALLRAWTGRDKLRDRQLFRTWLTRILINASHDILRKRKPTVPLENAREASEAFPDIALSEALGRLPEKLRLPLMLCYSENMTYAEISRALGIPATTVQSRLRKGKAMLRKELNEE